VTLVEMLVTLAVLLVMMTIIVQIFQAATGSLSGAQASQELDNKLKQLDATIRSDLRGVTARFTPPLNPKDNLGYFEYGENAFADLQGEDTDDYVRFTAKAPDGKPFTGRFWPFFFDNRAGSLTNGQQIPHPNGPITITSQYAEIIYFLRNGNLYRRVFLVAPERQSSIVQMVSGNHWDGVKNPTYTWPFSSSGSPVCWLGVNDLSARPAPGGSVYIDPTNPQGGVKLPTSLIILNTLGDLTNRENRAFSPRFANDFQRIDPGSGQPVLAPDNKADDFNLDDKGNYAGDGVPDYYPTLYPGVFSPTNPAGQLVYERGGWNGTPYVTRIVNATHPNDSMPFPYIFPGSYSMPEPGDPNGGLITPVGPFGNGWIHSPTPVPPMNPFPNTAAGALTYLRRLNHNPLDQGDNLPRPGQTFYQTWWGFPTWRETLSIYWHDPAVPVNELCNKSFEGLIISQSNGLHPRPANALLPAGKVFNNLDLLPPMTLTGAVPDANSNLVAIPVRLTEQPFTDGWGRDGQNNNNQILSAFLVNQSSVDRWNTSWEDDLIATGVRSFDVKAYDASLGQYVDLGWGDDLRFTGGVQNPVTGATVLPNAGLTLNNQQPYANQLPYTYGNYDFLTGSFAAPAYLYTNGTYADLLNQTMAHEGRIPPLVSDFRFDSQFGAVAYSGYANYTGNIGDDNPATIRLRRVWDSWSTDYSRARANGIDPTTGFPLGPPVSPPIYPSYPPPYPAPLRGIQIQLRVVDPVGQRIKVLTIRQDFTDKL
jgi:hypothetical protein